MSSIVNPNKGHEERIFVTLDVYRAVDSLREAAAIIEDMEKKTGYTVVGVETETLHGLNTRRFLIITLKDKRWYLPT